MTEQNKGVEIYQSDLHGSESGLESADALEIANFLDSYINYSDSGETIYDTVKAQLMTTYPTSPGSTEYFYYFRENGRGGWQRICQERKTLNVSMADAKTVVVAVEWEEVAAACPA